LPVNPLPDFIDLGRGDEFYTSNEMVIHLQSIWWRWDNSALGNKDEGPSWFVGWSKQCPWSYQHQGIMAHEKVVLIKLKGYLKKDNRWVFLALFIN